MDDISEQDVYAEAQRLALMATVSLENAMGKADLHRSELAQRLGVPRSRVTKVLDGESNITLRTLAQFGLACGIRWQFVGVDKADASRIVVSPPSLDRPYSLTECVGRRVPARFNRSEESDADTDRNAVMSHPIAS